MEFTLPNNWMQNKSFKPALKLTVKQLINDRRYKYFIVEKISYTKHA